MSLSAQKNKVANWLTIDVEDYYMVSAFESFVDKSEWGKYQGRVVDSTRKVLSLLKEAQVKATFFVVGWVAEKYPDLVREIEAAGHEVACHSFYHQLVYEMTPEQFRADLRRCREVLDKVLKQPMIGYRAPSFSLRSENTWMLDILKEEGFHYDSSALPAKHARGGIQDGPLSQRFPYRIDGIQEFPMSTLNVLGKNFPFSGGGYFRLFPYSWIKKGIESLNNQGQPAVIYLHPWEFDPGQPSMPVKGVNKFRHYVNLDKTEEKFRRLLSDFLFAPVQEIFKSRV